MSWCLDPLYFHVLIDLGVSHTQILLMMTVNYDMTVLCEWWIPKLFCKWWGNWTKIPFPLFHRCTLTNTDICWKMNQQANLFTPCLILNLFERKRELDRFFTYTMFSFSFTLTFGTLLHAHTTDVLRKGNLLKFLQFQVILTPVSLYFHLLWHVGRSWTGSQSSHATLVAMWGGGGVALNFSAHTQTITHTHRETDRQTDTQTHTHAHAHANSHKHARTTHTPFTWV